MQSGYTQFQVSTCIDNDFSTVEECANYGTNSVLVADHRDRFFYNNGHHQAWAMANGLGPLNGKDLADELNSYLDLGPDLSVDSLQLGGGLSLSAGSFADFLQGLLTQRYVLSSLLGSFKVCTWGEQCPQAIYSPVELPDEYSLGHWVESIDGAYSSAGLFGFYPWIDEQQTHYGIISRFSVDFSDGIGYGPGYTSMLCGQKIRKIIRELGHKKSLW